MRHPLAEQRRHQRLIAAALLATIAPTWPVSVAADDIDHRKAVVERRLNSAGRDLDQSSSELDAAIRALRVAQGRLSRARGIYADMHARLLAARALDALLQKRLVSAQDALRVARQDVTDAAKRIDRQVAALRRIAVSTYEAGDPSLLALSMVLKSQNPAELSSQLNSVSNLLAKKAAVLERLDATRAIARGREQARARAEKRVSRERNRAAWIVRRRVAIEKRASRAQAAVQVLLSKREAQRAAARRARVSDLRRLSELKRERQRVAQLLRRRAQQAKRRAAALTSSAGIRTRSTGRMAWPVSGPITSPFGMRFHPVFKRWSLHDGLDIGAACGTPVRAAASGRVVATYYNNAYGNRVIVDHGVLRSVAVATTYNHLSGFSAYIGQYVHRGDVIGFVGTTGASTGCHLHFMVLRSGAATNPGAWL